MAPSPCAGRLPLCSAAHQPKSSPLDDARATLRADSCGMEQTVRPSARETDRLNARRTIELAYRESGAVQVSLLWCQETGTLTVSVADRSTHDVLELVGLETSALDAFYHPYAYVAFRGVAYARHGELPTESEASTR